MKIVKTETKHKIKKKVIFIISGILYLIVGLYSYFRFYPSEKFLYYVSLIIIVSSLTIIISTFFF